MPKTTQKYGISFGSNSFAKGNTFFLSSLLFYAIINSFPVGQRAENLFLWHRSKIEIRAVGCRARYALLPVARHCRSALSFRATRRTGRRICTHTRTFGFAFPDSQGGEKTKLRAECDARSLSKRSNAPRRDALGAYAIDRRRKEKRPDGGIRHSINSANLHITLPRNSALSLNPGKKKERNRRCWNILIRNFISSRREERISGDWYC